MDKQDFEIMATKLLQSFRSGEMEPHEIHERLRQTLDQMRAYGMPLPEDLVILEQELAGEFEQEAQT